MSELDVHRIICPSVEEERDQFRAHLRTAEEHVIFLRKVAGELAEAAVWQSNPLRHAYPVLQAAHRRELPHPYDGEGWAKLQEQGMADPASRTHSESAIFRPTLPTLPGNET